MAEVTPMSGRRAQAARNDTLIMEAARAVFIDNPEAPIAAVAREANVGISALYKRFASKEAMLVKLCADGLRQYIDVANAALDIDDAWESFVAFARGIVDADVHSLTQRLAGKFVPTEELGPLSAEAGGLGARILKNAKAAGVIRADLTANDLSMLFEQLTAVRLGEADRTRALRHRYLALALDALRPSAAVNKLPGKGPTDAELGQRWSPAGR